MKKIAIFNVGGALSAFIEIDDMRSLIDLGASSNFSPVDDFLIPLSKIGKFPFRTESPNPDRFVIDQLFLSHLDNDHISDYKKFRETFHPNYMTCPNDNKNQDHVFKINRSLLGDVNEVRELVLKDMMGRGTSDTWKPSLTPSNPLISLTKEISIHYIAPYNCESNSEIIDGYPNNISLVLFIKVGMRTVLFTGDMLKNGMKYLITNNKDFRAKLETDGVDFLIAPHHGLQTSFSELLFQTMKNNKTRINIIPEKIRSSESEENRSDVDKRYYNSEYSTGENTMNQNAIKTSIGHLVIDFEAGENIIKQINDNDELLREFF